jgi:hypothetical protein
MDEAGPKEELPGNKPVEGLGSVLHIPEDMRLWISTGGGGNGKNVEDRPILSAGKGGVVRTGAAARHVRDLEAWQETKERDA